MIYAPINWDMLENPLDILFMEIPNRTMRSKDDLQRRGWAAKFICERCGQPISKRSARYGNHCLCSRCNQTHTFDKCGLIVTWYEDKIIREMVTPDTVRRLP